MAESAINRAKEESVRFLGLGRDEKKARVVAAGSPCNYKFIVDIPKENAALLRASMDLPRALADMRQGRE